MKSSDKALIYTARSIAIVAILFVVCGFIIISLFFWNDRPTDRVISAQTELVQPGAALEPVQKRSTPVDSWKAPNESTIPAGKYGDMIKYGKDLVVNTSKYFGPNGTVAQISNGMNCQNCHLEAGTKPFANNFSVFISSYPKKSNRSGKIEPPSERIAECFERSLNGKVPDESGKEIQAMLAYMTWVGTGVNKGDIVFGNSTEKLKYLDRAADPKQGLILYNNKCQSCHGTNGEGIIAQDKLSYVYPPLWGKDSYSDGAGQYRLSNFAGFVKNNMPLGATYDNPQLSDEEAWDLAAFVNSQPRPHRTQKKDYPDLTKKPIDAPYGPYADKYPEQQHKFGPYGSIVFATK